MIQYHHGPPDARKLLEKIELSECPDGTFEIKDFSSEHLLVKRHRQNTDKVLKLIADQFQPFSAKEVKLLVVDHTRHLDAWPSALHVTEVDILRWLGLGPEVFQWEDPTSIPTSAAFEYCKVLRVLCEIPGVTLAPEFIACLDEGRMMPHPYIIKAQLKLGENYKQEVGGDLIVRRLAFNQATGFKTGDGTPRVIQPKHIPKLLFEYQSKSFKNLSALGMMSVAVWLNSNPKVRESIKMEESKRVDVSGTMIQVNGKFSGIPDISNDLVIGSGSSTQPSDFFATPSIAWR